MAFFSCSLSLSLLCLSCQCREAQRDMRLLPSSALAVPLHSPFSAQFEGGWTEL